MKTLLLLRIPVYFKFDPICLRSGLLMRVEKGIAVCSPSRLTLRDVSYILLLLLRKTDILILTGISTASELAKEKGSMIHLPGLREGERRETEIST
jgi:hypothetical protein